MDGYPITLAKPPTRVRDSSLPLCCTLEQIAADVRLSRDTLLGMPWFSPILGSGCLDLGEGPDLQPEALRGVRATIDRAVPDSARAAVLDSAVAAFVASLTEARAPGLRAIQTPGNGGAATRLVILAALATRAFHKASFGACQPVGERFLANAVPLPSKALKDPEGDLRDIERHLLVELQQPNHLQELASYWKTEAFWQNLVDYLVGQLDRPGPGPSGTPSQGWLSGFDVQLLTEFAWLMVVRKSTLYPGWSDLLVGLMGAHPQADQIRGIRQTPTQIDATIAGEIRQLLEPATTESWKARVRDADTSADPPRRDRRTFYSEIALLLDKQARLRRLLEPFDPKLDDGADDYPVREEQRTKSQSDARDLRRRLTNEAAKRENGFKDESWSAPGPVAVVTSFDIELEMALWSLRLPFVVVLPMLVASQRSSSQPGRVVWLAAKFDPTADASEDELLESAGKTEPEQEEREVQGLRTLRCGKRSWFPAGEIRKQGALADCTNLPTIVRLSGSPLIRVSPDDVDVSYLQTPRSDTYDFIHALTIDEYSSLRLSAHEIYSLTVRGKPTGLPRSMLVGTHTMPRVWVSFGVQVDDPATRMRLFSQLSVASVAPSFDDLAREGGQEGSDGGGDQPISGTSPRAAAGLAINRRFNDADAAVMRWLGFEFAEAEVSTIIGQVRHYVDDHLEWALQQLTGDDLQSWPAVVGEKADDSRLVAWRRAQEDHCDVLRRGQL